MRRDELRALAAAAVVLTQDAIDAQGRRCAAGSQIAPQVDGWPVHRVMAHLQQGMAEPMKPKAVAAVHEVPTSASPAAVSEPTRAKRARER
jgi:hypothetical protein